MKEIALKNGGTAVIRQAGKADAKGISEYINAVCGETDFLTFGPGEFPLTVEQEENFLEGISRQKNAVCFLAKSSGRIVATLSFSGGTKPRIAHTGEMGVSVLREFWGNGIGAALIESLIEWCRQSGIVRKINLRVRTDNASAIRLYKKLGFTESGTVTREFLVNGVFYDALLMGYEID
jgi:RimJ/RimL family protein N-acetyltransferase